MQGYSLNFEESPLQPPSPLGLGFLLHGSFFSSPLAHIFTFTSSYSLPKTLLLPATRRSSKESTSFPKIEGFLSSFSLSHFPYSLLFSLKLLPSIFLSLSRILFSFQPQNPSLIAKSPKSKSPLHSPHFPQLIPPISTN